MRRIGYKGDRHLPLYLLLLDTQFATLKKSHPRSNKYIEHPDHSF